MLYVELDERGQAIRERVIDAVLPEIPRWVDGKRISREPEDEAGKEKWAKAPLALKPLTIVETPIDPAEFKTVRYKFENQEDGTVAKLAVVEELSQEEKDAYALQTAKATRMAALPPIDELMELVLTAIKVVLDRQIMSEVPTDPRTRVSISQAGYDQLRTILAVLRATPVPGQEDFTIRTGKLSADPSTVSKRDAEINIFNNRVQQVANNKDVPQAIKDAFTQLMKLIT